MRAELAASPNDTSIHMRLKALGDLQSVVQASTLPPDQLELIRNKVTELAAVTMRALSGNSNNVPPPMIRPSQTPPVSSSVAPPPNPGAVSLDSLLGPGALAALMARSSATPQNSTPYPPPPSLAQALRSPQPAAAEPAKPALNPSNPIGLLEQLRQAGLLGTPVNATPPAPAASLPLPPSALPPSIAQLLASRMGSAQNGSTPVTAPGMIDINALKST
jgi:pre-mRNA cleavage complex 2 protein Pcf11